MALYFQLLLTHDYHYGVAYLPPSANAFVLPLSGVKVESWEHITLELRNGEYADFQASDLVGARLCSENLRKVIENNRSGNDEIQWLEVSVLYSAIETRRYYVIHFPVNYPIINKEKSLMAGHAVVKPVLSLENITGHEIFAVPSGRRIFVSEKMKNAIETAKLTGLSFSRVSAK
jgi:hypothetical protein